MAATQTRIRRGTASQINAMTPAADELISDTTNNRLRIGDGLTPGGMQIPNAVDILNNELITGIVGGTENDIALTLNPAPSAYGPYFTVEFLATDNNTGPVTVKVNSLAVQNVKKLSGNTLVPLVANDIVDGGIYRLSHNGTDFQLMSSNSSGSSMGSESQIIALTGSSVEFNVDFAVYSQYKLNIVNATASGSQQNIYVDTSSNNGANWSRFVYNDAIALNTNGGYWNPGNGEITLTQPLANDKIYSNAMVSIRVGGASASYQSVIGGSNNTHSNSVNKIKISCLSSFLTGYAILTPIGKRS